MLGSYVLYVLVDFPHLLSLGQHCVYFRMQKLKPWVAKVSTVASVMRDK